MENDCWRSLLSSNHSFIPVITCAAGSSMENQDPSPCKRRFSSVQFSSFSEGLRGLVASTLSGLYQGNASAVSTPPCCSWHLEFHAWERGPCQARRILWYRRKEKEERRPWRASFFFLFVLTKSNSKERKKRGSAHLGRPPVVENAVHQVVLAVLGLRRGTSPHVGRFKLRVRVRVGVVVRGQ